MSQSPFSTSEDALQHRRANLRGLSALQRRVFAVGGLDLSENLRRGLHAEIGGVERLLQLFERRDVDLAPAEQAVRFRRDRRNRLGEAVLEFLEEGKHRGIYDW